MFTKPPKRAPRYILIKSFFLVIGWSYPWSFTHVFKKIETTMRWDCMTKALRFLQITAEYQVGQFLKLKLKLKPLQGPNLAWDYLWAARLAQSVEHQTFNLRVMGSSPISGDFPFYEFSRLCFDFFWARKWLMYHMKYAKESAYIHTYMTLFYIEFSE